ncbi:DNA-directed RNA polymerase subunit D [Candidatus Woesearchaeota archaeon]|nr:DNA-directed RNA polymerase subunit D [Candidatus Woesearchaeota archaeon]
MEIELLEKSKDGMKITFLARGITPAIANTIRRAISEEVLTFAIEEVEFRKNGSVLYDEIIAHRLGLIPLKTDLKSYEFVGPDKSMEELSAKQRVTFTLKAKGPCIVYASELESSDKSVVPVYPGMPIATLSKGQSLELAATAVLGKGKNHSKWSPGHAYYYNETKITVNNDSSLLEKFRNKYPPQIFGKDGSIDKSLINRPELIDACDGISKLIEIEKKEDSFIFVLESWGQLTPKEIVLEAIEQINMQLDEVCGLIKEK